MVLKDGSQYVVALANRDFMVVILSDTPAANDGK
jgi:hypothetical protein